ncbi:twitching motility protein PilT [Thermococcus guaymasensis DSM 11113]|uniref:Twitching motility protein PilT n=1 Tax=Thermococcus guaymasensis DSM 11113 TaxID=1432656 RepID=A0A0X1KL73_9EURY|nr:type II toxin-antitoxin system VapC family toxin [Thermococcus guaymasensis]AJC71985.1 twitching motility protein PilT [Thermococcus guaymasensis DSM 11113]
MVKLLDTNVMIEIFKGNRKIIDQLPPDEEYALPSIVLFELLAGNPKPHQRLALEKMPVYNFDRTSAEIAGEIFWDLVSKGKRPPTKDLLIASTAIAYDVELFTCDKDFERFKEYGLKVKILEK